MIYSYNTKRNLDIDQEDPKTSTIFELLLCFPDNYLWDIIYNAIMDKRELPKYVGNLCNYIFWPKWDKEGTTNSIYVEPDLFLRFNEVDIIIEAKRSDNVGQDKNEWYRELRTYYNEYSAPRKVILIAVGGNKDVYREQLYINSFGSHYIYKCSWLSLLISVQKVKSTADKKLESNIVRLCNTLVLGFRMHNVNYFLWLDSLQLKSIQKESMRNIMYYFNDKASEINNFNELSINKIQTLSFNALESFFYE